jgi:hypothetical protein
MLLPLELVPGFNDADAKEAVVGVINRYIVAGLKGKEPFERLNRGCLVGIFLLPYQIGDFVDRLAGKIDIIKPANGNVAPIAEALPRLRFLARDMGR